jgi:hypothetical protein
MNKVLGKVLPVALATGIIIGLLGIKEYSAAALAAVLLAMFLLFTFQRVATFRLASMALLAGKNLFLRTKPIATSGAQSAARGLGQTGTKLAKGGMELANAGLEAYKLMPWLWTGIFFVLYAFWVFLDACSEMDPYLYHKAGALLLIAAGLFITHFEQWETVARKVFGNLTRSWVVASAIVLVVAVGHISIDFAMIAKNRDNLTALEALLVSYYGDTGWWFMASASALSLAAAVITLMKGWGTTAHWARRVFAFIGELFIGKRGPLMTVVSWSVLLAVITLYYFGKQQAEGGYEGELTSSIALFLVILLGGLAWVIVPSNKK